MGRADGHERSTGIGGSSYGSLSAAPRIVQVCAVDFTAYHLLRPLLHACRDAGWVTEFACADGPLARRLRDEGFAHRAIPMTRSASPQLAAATAALAVSLTRDRPDLVHTHTPAGGIAGRAAAAVARVPGIVHTFHGLPFLGTRPRGIERAFLGVERLLARQTDLFFSQAEGDGARAAELGIARIADTVVIGNGVDLKRFAPDAVGRSRVRAALGLAEDDVAMVYVGRLVREKGLIELAEAALSLRDLPRVHVLIAGASLSSDRTDVTAELDRHAVVRSLGARWCRLGYRDDVYALLKAADMFVLPSYREGLPRSVIEAMATGLPVVATDIPACRELIEEGASGVLVPPRDAPALAAALRSLAADAATRARWGAYGRELAEERHDERAVVARQIEHLARVARV